VTEPVAAAPGLGATKVRKDDAPGVGARLVLGNRHTYDGKEVELRPARGSRALQAAERAASIVSPMLAVRGCRWWRAPHVHGRDRHAQRRNGADPRCCPARGAGGALPVRLGPRPQHGVCDQQEKVERKPGDGERIADSTTRSIARYGQAGEAICRTITSSTARISDEPTCAPLPRRRACMGDVKTVTCCRSLRDVHPLRAALLAKSAHQANCFVIIAAATKKSDVFPGHPLANKMSGTSSICARSEPGR